MKTQLPIIGQVKTGKDAEKVQTRTRTVYKQPDMTEVVKEVQKSIAPSGVLGGFFEFTGGGLSNEKTISSKLLKANTGWVYRNNDVIAKEVGAIELELYTIKVVNGDFEYNRIYDHPLLDAIDKFNTNTTRQDGFYTTQSHKKLTGDAFWLLDWQGSELTNIYLLEPDKVELDLGTPNDKTDSFVKGYKYKDTVDGQEIDAYYYPDQIIHFRTPNPSNPFRGYGAVEAAADTIDTDNLAQETMKKFYLNGAIVNFILTTEGRITQDQLKRLRAELKANYSGTANAYKTMILGGGFKPETIQLSNREQEFLKQLEWYRDKIMVLFGNTKASLGIVDDVNRATHESAMVSWRKNSIKPEMQALVNTLNEFLVPRYGNNLVLTFKDPVGEDRTALLEEATVLIQQDIADVNEVRELLGLDARPNEVNDSLRAEKEPVPESLENIDLKTILRSRGHYQRLQQYNIIKAEAKKIAERIVKSRKKKNEPNKEVREHALFSNAKVWEYWAKQIRITETVEANFKNKVSQFIDKVRDEALANLPEEVPKTYRKKQLFNKDELLVTAELDFTPLLTSVAIKSGQEALDLIDSDNPYIPDVENLIKGNIRRFTGSMLSTEQDKMAKIISQGIKNGLSIPQIRASMLEAFDQLNKVQADRVTRTEVLRISNQSAVDAWAQSGVVEGKQWLTAEDDRVDGDCKELNGRIISLSDTYLDKGASIGDFTNNYADVDEPPLHPNCRCVVLPVLLNEKSVQHKEKLSQKRIKELESELAKEREYIKELEDIADGQVEGD